MTTEILNNIQVMDINDHKEETEESVVPFERQIIDAVIEIWKEDPSTETLGVPKLHGLVKSRHKNWALSEKRVRTLLKKYGLLANNPDQQYTYASEITSQETPDMDLPDKIKVLQTSKKGKGLYAKKNVKKGDFLWEEKPLFYVPPLANMTLIKNGKACSYCGKLLTQGTRGNSGVSYLRGLDCDVCSEIWCSKECKNTDLKIHALLKHNVYHPSKSNTRKNINANAYLALQDYCLKEQWNALYSITRIYADIVSDKSGVKERQFSAMARISQETRYKALNSSAGSFDNFQGGALFVQEQQESLWKEGFSLFSNVFPNSVDEGKINYDEFMYMLGTFNINNLDSVIFLIQSHLNHNCEPNTTVKLSSNRTEGLKVYAARDIKAGEELTTSYVNPSHTVQQRQRELRVNWGFRCACEKCKSELKEQHRRKSSSQKSNSEKDSIREMLLNTKAELGDTEITLDDPKNPSKERRKSVRFDEKVIAVSK